MELVMMGITIYITVLIVLVIEILDNLNFVRFKKYRVNIWLCDSYLL